MSTIGSTWTPVAYQRNNLNQEYSIALPATVPVDGTIDKLTAMLDYVGYGVGVVQDFRAMLYTDVSNAPGTLIATTPIITVTSDSASDTGTYHAIDFAFSSPVEVSAGTVWLAIHDGPFTGPGPFTIARDDSGLAGVYAPDGFADGVNTSFGTAFNNGNSFVITANFTPDSTGTTLVTSSTPLAANETYVSSPIDTTTGGDVTANFTVTPGGASGTLSIEDSADGITFATVGATATAGPITRTCRRYVRVRYVNGATAQTSFSLTLTLGTDVTPPPGWTLYLGTASVVKVYLGVNEITSLAVGSTTPGSGSTFISGSDAPGADVVLDAMYGGPESGSWLTTKLPDNTAVEPTSATAVQYIVDTYNAYGGWINGVADGNWTSVINVVPADTPLVPVIGKGNVEQEYAADLKAMLAAGVPIPADIPPFAPGDGDAELVIIQPDWVGTVAGNGGGTVTGRMYELWIAQHPSTTVSGEWECYWGGRMTGIMGDSAPQAWWDGYKPINRYGHWIDYFVDDYADPDTSYSNHNWGAQATSIPLTGTLLTRLDVLRGVINHPIHYELPIVDQSVQGTYTWPAMRWDGGSHQNCPHGTRMRFPAGYPINPAWPWLTKLIVTCIRDYGMVQTDTVGPTTGPTFRMEPGAADLVPGGVNLGAVTSAIPWGDLEQIAVGSDTNPNPTTTVTSGFGAGNFGAGNFGG